MLDSVAVEEHRCVREDVRPLLTIGVVSLACPFLILCQCVRSALIMLEAIV